jgi:hypothetical protein
MTLPTTSTALESLSGPDAVVVDAFQIVHGHVGGGGGVPLVVKDQLKSALIASPASSSTPAGSSMPPLVHRFPTWVPPLVAFL